MDNPLDNPMGLQLDKLAHAVQWWRQQLPASVFEVLPAYGGMGHCNLVIKVDAEAKDELDIITSQLKTECPPECTFFQYFIKPFTLDEKLANKPTELF